MERQDYWDKRHGEAQIALEVAETQLLKIQSVGQLALFAPPKPNVIALRRGEIRNQYDNFAEGMGSIHYPDFGRSSFPDVSA